MEMVLLITVREAVSLLHRTPARFTSSLRKYVTKKPKQAPCVVSVSAFSNILNEVYSERSCLICVLNNKETASLRHSKWKSSFQGNEFQQKYRIENGKMTDGYWTKLI